MVKCVNSDSRLSRKVAPGWELISVNEHPVKDVLDYKFYTYEARLKLKFLRPDGKEKTVRVRKAEGEDLGLDFEDYLMDAPRSCANNCVFCFIDQNPPGMRKTIYFKDDDARLSFLMGCYITLTNLSDREIERIIALKISPVNISVHTTDPELRCSMLKNKFAGRCYDIMRRLASAGIVMNCQIVSCPGINDGEAILRTLRDLKALFPAVHSISVVPLGLTAHRQGLPELHPYTRETAGELLDRVNAFGDECVKELGTRLVFCSDEFYLKSERELPPDSFYEEHTQLENGVGMLRLLEKEFLMALDYSDPPVINEFSIATGEAAYPLIKKLAEALKNKYPVSWRT
ncbi:MAG: DUF512 domain-containing protein [Oscillospiraceae bacterium]|nr:DUF512 domain-containing protein [Oscillospiraceae bacterium]